MSNKSKAITEQLFAQANVKINGQNAWDIQVHNEKLYDCLLHQPILGLGESYMNGWWDCEQLDQFFYRILRAKLSSFVKKDRRFLSYMMRLHMQSFFLRAINLQSYKRAFEVGRHHYDVGNELYQCMLDKGMNYSCGYWKSSDNLDAAQVAKLDLACRKLQLQPGMKVLDIGCGWGGFSKYAAENYGVSVVGVTISQKQYEYAKQRCVNLPVEIRLQDYRELTEKFDRICSIGMFEHVGYKNYRTYMQVAHRCLADDGIFLLHTIGSNISLTQVNEWVHKYIFPNGMLPSITQIGKSIERLFVMEDWHNFGSDYDKTLMAWQSNFVQHWDAIKTNYDERFYRMWNYYLLSCAGAFRARDIQLWQIVLSKQGMLGGYASIR